MGTPSVESAIVAVTSEEASQIAVDHGKAVGLDWKLDGTYVWAVRHEHADHYWLVAYQEKHYSSHDIWSLVVVNRVDGSVISFTRPLMGGNGVGEAIEREFRRVVSQSRQ